MFGVAIVCEYSDTGEFQKAFPARVPYRGFGPQSVDQGFKNLHRYLAENIEAIRAETDE